MVRVVTQETYEAVVLENINEFDMQPEEAIQDAIAQFEAQGVDLSHIIKDLAIGNGDGHLVTCAVEKLKKLTLEGTDEEISEELEILKKECSKDMARRIRAGKDGAYNLLIDLLDKRLKAYLQEKTKSHEDFLLQVVDCLVALMDTQPDLLDEKGMDLVKSILDNVTNEEILISTLKWTTHCCVKHEMNRQKLFAKNIGDSLKLMLSYKDPKVISEALQVIRKFTLDDDIRVEFGKTHEHSRELGVLLLVPLYNLMEEHPAPPLVSEVMLTLASLLVRHELCKMAADCGLHVLYAVMAGNYDNVAVTTQANKLITALAGNDDVKKDIVRIGMIPVIVSILNRHSNNASATKYTLKCIAALSLRESAHSKEFLENGAPEAIVDCMKIHQDNPSVMRNACLAIRNLTARVKTHNDAFKQLGVEAILNEAYEQFGKEFGFDIKSALRDLDCDVKLSEQWTGKGVQLDN